MMIMYTQNVDLLLTLLGGKIYSMWSKSTMYFNKFTNDSTILCDYDQATHMPI